MAREKLLGYSENERMLKVKINACTRMENMNASFNPIRNSKALGIVLSENKEQRKVKTCENCESIMSNGDNYATGFPYFFIDQTFLGNLHFENSFASAMDHKNFLFFATLEVIPRGFWRFNGK